MPVAHVTFEAKGCTVQEVADQQWRIATQVVGGHSWWWDELGDIEPDELVSDYTLCDISAPELITRWKRDVSLSVEYNL